MMERKVLNGTEDKEQFEYLNKLIKIALVPAFLFYKQEDLFIRDSRNGFVLTEIVDHVKYGNVSCENCGHPIRIANMVTKGAESHIYGSECIVKFLSLKEMNEKDSKLFESFVKLVLKAKKWNVNLNLIKRTEEQLIIKYPKNISEIEDVSRELELHIKKIKQRVRALEKQKLREVTQKSWNESFNRGFRKVD